MLWRGLRAAAQTQTSADVPGLKFARGSALTALGVMTALGKTVSCAGPNRAARIAAGAVPALRALAAQPKGPAMRVLLRLLQRRWRLLWRISAATSEAGRNAEKCYVFPPLRST